MVQSDRLAQLSATKRALLERLMESKGTGVVQASVGDTDQIPIRPMANHVPLSLGQERLWFLQQFDPETSAYNVPAALRFRGPLNVTALERAFNQVVQRHEALRTTFQVVGETPVQVIAPTAQVDLPVVDLQHLPEDEREAMAMELAQAEAQRPFDLTRGPLLRAVLFRLNPDDHLVFSCIHHIISDGWSMGIVRRELRTLYEAYATGNESPLPPLAIQYGDFAVWQKEWLQNHTKKELDYWKGQLGGTLPVLTLPTARPRPLVQTSKGSRRTLFFANTLHAQLEALSRQEGVTLFMTLLAAFKVLLYRYSRQEDIIVGTPVAGRMRPETEPLVGFFANTLVLRSRLDGQMSFRDFLRQVRSTAMKAYAHQNVTFEQIVEILHPERNLSHSPIFQVMFGFLSAPVLPPVQLPGLTIAPVEVDSGHSRFDLTVEIEENDRGLVCMFEYNTDLFNAETIDRLLLHYKTLLECACVQPDQSLSALDFLTEAERRQLVVDWNSTTHDYVRDACVHELVEAQAERTPDVAALVFGEETLSYRELNRRANRIAHYLRELGVGPETLVGISMKRSPAMLAGLLGILKAGGAYVPLDPTYPPERLALVLEDAGVSILLTQEDVLPRLPAAGVRVACLDRDWDQIARRSDANPGRVVVPANLAYVIYTSGSTGRPKGVAVNHGSVVNFFAGMDSRIGCSSADSLLALTSISFDISVLELFWTLANGARIVLGPEESVLNIGGKSDTEKAALGTDFSLFYFARVTGEDMEENYQRLMVEGAKFADRNGFTAVWTPERHFHEVGGFYPNPAVTSAAIAMVTDRIQIRAGSVVLPLHNPLRVAEEWAVVDHLSGGRVGLAFASGWQSDDFVLAPDNYRERKQLMMQGIDTVRRLWAGEAVTVRSGSGREIPVRTFPRPLQKQLPIWLTSAGHPDTFVEAGRLGAGVLTHLLNQSVEELAEKIALYRESLAQHGHDPASGRVVLMLHTFVGEDLATVREVVRQPFRNFLRSSAELWESLARNEGLAGDLDRLTEEDREALLTMVYERFFESRGLFGTPETCMKMVARLHGMGVDEIACFIDFGIETDVVLQSLHHLNTLRQHCAGVQRDESLLTQAARHHVTMMQCTPSLMRMIMADAEAPGALASLSKLMVGGEALPADLAATLREKLPARLINMYGPTETTIWSATHEVVEAGDGIVPIGRPIANTQIYLLDDHLQPVPRGLLGEVYIGGEGLARGYLGRSDLTAERFLPNPFTSLPGARLYRTGDVGRQLPDGTIEFLNRADQQVKLRGYRVELGEIESGIRQHPGVAEAVVLVRDEPPEHKYLVAFFVPAVPEETPSPRELMQFLGDKVPAFMVPSTFTALAEMPLTPNGKVDRKALLALKVTAQVSQETHVAPRTPVEEVVATVWAELLRRDSIGVHDNFFELGGNSLVGTQMIVRLRELFQVEISVRKVFEVPTVAGVAESVEEARRTASGVEAPPLKPVDRSGEIPLSFAQQRLWFLEQLNPGNFAYNVPFAVRLKGELNVAAMEASISAVVQRHEAMRTVIATVKGKGSQVILAPSPVSLPVVDLRMLHEAEREQEVRRRFAQEAEHPFNLARGPLWRVQLLQTHDDEQVLIVTVHHMISDAWSTGILLNEVATLYTSFQTGTPSPLPELQIQYADFAHWQREWLQGDVLQTQLDYWKQQLHDIQVLELPTDRPRSAVQTFRGAIRSRRLPESLTRALKDLNRREGATLFMTLLAAYKVLLYRYTRQDDIAVGSPIANRNRVETEGIIGFFVNTIVLRTDLSGSPRFVDLIKRVREVSLGAYAHQDVPFEKLVEHLQPDRSLNQTPFFQVQFALQNAPLMTLQLPGVSVEVIEPDAGTAKFDLVLSVTEDGPELVTRVEYSTDLFDESTVLRFMEHYCTLLEGVVANPEQKIDDIPLLSEAERQLVLDQWNQTARPYDSDLCVHDLVEAQGERTPDGIAVVFADESLTYAELNRRANQLAHRLQKLGVGPDARVGIFMEPSISLVLCLLGALKAGAAYVPLDPAYPKERLAIMLDDAQVTVLVTETALLAELPEQGSPVFALDAEWERIAQEPETNPASGARPDNLAYIIFTSGSTGRPKGVAMTHRPLVNLLTWHQQAIPVTPGLRTIQFASVSFDVAFQETFTTWSAGGTLVLVSNEVRRDSGALLRYLCDMKIERFFQPFVALQHVAEASRASGLVPASLRDIIPSGEPLKITPPVRAFLEQLPGCRVHNQYGPSETHVITNITLEGDPGSWNPLPPIGKPISNSHIYLLDPALRPVPIGVPGELYIGGVCLSRGYLGRPDLTAERYVASPFGQRPGELLYKSGDLARYLADGSIQFFGRADDQVKIRGFRVELGEVEVALSKHPEVSKAVVAVTEDANVNKRLVAYVVPALGAELSVGQLQAFLKNDLPEYMVPAAVVFLESLPLTPSGKVNRRALPTLEEASVNRSETYVAPRNDVEEVLAGIWRRVLDIQVVGIHDNFFDLGGHSLLATQLTSQLREIFQMEVSLRRLFEAPTIAELAEALMEQAADPRHIQAVARIHRRLEAMSPEEIQALLAAKKTIGRGTDGHEKA